MEATVGRSPPCNDMARNSNTSLETRPIYTSNNSDIEAANTLVSLPAARIIDADKSLVNGPDASLSSDFPSISAPFLSDQGYASSRGSSISSKIPVSAAEQTHGLKRSKKLDQLLQRIRDQANPDLVEHNEKVKNLCDSTISFTSVVPATAEQLGHLLGDLGHVSDVLGFMYGLLSWEGFRREERRLITEEGQSARWAAKRVS